MVSTLGLPLAFINNNLAGGSGSYWFEQIPHFRSGAGEAFQRLATKPAQTVKLSPFDQHPVFAKKCRFLRFSS
jgi:hypothetical protein